MGNGCSKCQYENNSRLRRNSKDIFVDKANHVHSCQYNYDKVVYESNKKAVCITCLKHR